MRTTLAAMALTLVFAVCANADVIHQTDFEADGAAQGEGFGAAFAPGSLDFSNGGADFIGPDGLGLSDDSGSFAHTVDIGNTLPNEFGWGGTWAGQNSDSGGNSGGFGVEADVIAAGAGCYIDYSEGATFTISVDVATDADDEATGTAMVAAPRLEFKSLGAELFRNDAGAPLTSATLTTAFQTMTWSYTLTAADAALGIDQVTAVVATAGLGHEANDGLVYFDNFLFEVNSENVVVVGAGHAIPEPGSAGLLLAGVLGFCGIRRKKN